MAEFRRTIIEGAINSDGAGYRRLRIGKKHWNKFIGIDRLVIKYNGDYFITRKNKLFNDYGEIDNVKIGEWFEDEHIKLNIDMTYLHNLNEIEIL